MKFVRSDSPEVARDIASTRTLARRHGSAFLVVLLPNLVILLFAAVGLIVSLQAALWIGLPAFLAWNAWVLWRTKSPRLSWVVKARCGRMYIRLFVGFGKAWREVDLPDVIEFEASEIASISIRTVKVFLCGPKPRQIKWLVIEPSQEVAESLSSQIPSYLRDARMSDFGTPDLSERVYWDDERRLAVGWKFCHPSPWIFLKQIARECPSIVIGPVERSELDLNGIWHGLREEPDAQQRRMLVQAKRFGFGCELPGLLSRYRIVPYRKAAAYLVKIEQEEAGKEHA